jgi:hypothetical protein
MHIFYDKIGRGLLVQRIYWPVFVLPTSWLSPSTHIKPNRYITPYLYHLIYNPEILINVSYQLVGMQVQLVGMGLDQVNKYLGYFRPCTFFATRLVVAC